MSTRLQFIEYFYEYVVFLDFIEYFQVGNNYSCANYIIHMESQDMTLESHNMAVKKTLTNFQWTTFMTSFMLRALVEQANLGLKSDKRLKSVAITAVARVVSVRFTLAVSDTHVNNLLWHVRKIWSIIKKIKSLSDVS